jgi:hypothetical protein
MAPLFLVLVAIVHFQQFIAATNMQGVDKGVVDNARSQNVPKAKAEGLKLPEITKDRKKFVSTENTV